jgi:SsrA-binding protein
MRRDILQNARARRDYHILDTYEAGLVLRGTEVKSLRAGRGQLSDSFARIENGQAWLHNAHIDEYSHGNQLNHVPKTPRKLLLHKAEIRKLMAVATIKGHALIPLSMYWKENRVKVQIGVGKGKDLYDKREDLKQRDADMEMRRATAHAFKRK